MNRQIFLVLAASFAGLSSGLLSDLNEVSNGIGAAESFTGWPSEYQGNKLTQLALSAREQGFVTGFPGKIGRFSDGQQQIIIRWISQASRKLHPAADCFKGIGYEIIPQPITFNPSGIKMGCFIASKSSPSTDERINVCEYIVADDGRSWSDISAWYWSAIFDDAPKGWWSYVVASQG